MMEGYADGILSGCTLSATQDVIVVNKGAVWMEGQIFLIKEPLTINYSPTNTTTVLKLCFADEVRDADSVYYEMNLVLTRDCKAGKKEIELCRFKLQEGAQLRYHYQDFEDRITEFDTMNRIHVPYASYGRSTLSPDITRAFANEMLDTGSLRDFDAAFCLQILASDRPIAAEALIRYIEYTNNQKLENCTNEGIYRELTQILSRQKGTKEPPAKQGKAKKWKVLME